MTMPRSFTPDRLATRAYEYAALLLLLDDRPRYQQFCQELVARAGEPQRLEAYNLARICSIGPADGIDASRIVDWASRGLGRSPTLDVDSSGAGGVSRQTNSNWRSSTSKNRTLCRGATT